MAHRCNLAGGAPALQYLLAIKARNRVVGQAHRLPNWWIGFSDLSAVAEDEAKINRRRRENDAGERNGLGECQGGQAALAAATRPGGRVPPLHCSPESL